eukprot:CAMPEP_0119498848 /NCGR_PEP_ID=MMETSP1344-20130328/21493_1 /TAXON_ID=236787 /ORGANISM="Florenciella parvula, Strain CCMP2471" /LENGTH=55 /DNA_ID=CAMNT_0007534783 /DNA_START=287 /DNA_END=450 /DNA_ORIENTATION=+
MVVAESLAKASQSHASGEIELGDGRKCVEHVRERGREREVQVRASRRDDLIRGPA